MPALQIFISGPYTLGNVESSFVDSLIFALDRAGADVYYHYQMAAPEITSVERRELSLRPVSIMLIPQLASAQTSLLGEELRRLQSILAFNPTRVMITIPLRFSTSAALNAPYAPDFLMLSQYGLPEYGTPEVRDAVIAQILDILALPSPSPSASPESASIRQDISAKDKLTRSKALNLQGRHTDASAILSEIAIRTPDMEGVWTNLGYTFSEMEQWIAGIEACQYAFEVMHERTTSTRCLGTCLTGLGRYEEACAAFRRALATNRNYGAAWLGLGIGLLGLEQVVEAYKAFDHVRHIDMNNPWAYENEQVLTQASHYIERLRS